jgi:hypothetical protein
MIRFETAQATAAYRNPCEDRVAVIQDRERTVIVVADGAGGIGNGDQAAMHVVNEVRACYAVIKTAAEWETALRQIDCRVDAGESTAVVVDLRPDAIIGASVGDSCAWLIEDGELLDLTAGQIRKPLLGSHEAEPRAFEHASLTGLLLVASDGFCNYAKRERIPALVAKLGFFELPRHLLESVRLPSGELWDDVSIVAARRHPQRRTKQQYVIE